MLFFKKSLAFKKNSTIISRDISFSWMNNFEKLYPPKYNYWYRAWTKFWRYFSYFEQVIINDFTQLEDELFNDIIFPGSQTNLE